MNKTEPIFGNKIKVITESHFNLLKIYCKINSQITISFVYLHLVLCSSSILVNHWKRERGRRWRINVCKCYYGGVQSNHVKPLSVVQITTTKKNHRSFNSRPHFVIVWVCMPFSGYNTQSFGLLLFVGFSFSILVASQSEHINKSAFQCFRMIDFVYWYKYLNRKRDEKSVSHGFWLVCWRRYHIWNCWSIFLSL